MSSQALIALARRSALRTLRQPEAVVPALALPLLMLAVNKGSLGAAALLPGFPAESYTSFALASAFLMGALFAPTLAGNDLAVDIQSGLLNRLVLTQTSHMALLVGQLAGTALVACAQALAFLGAGLLAGVEVAAGLPGAAALLLLSLLITLSVGSLGICMALLTRSSSAVQGLFGLSFALLFFSSANLPRELIEARWFRSIAAANPLSYLVEGLRSLLIAGWDPRALALSAGVAAGIMGLSLGLGARLLTKRMAQR